MCKTRIQEIKDHLLFLENGGPGTLRDLHSYNMTIRRLEKELAELEGYTVRVKRRDLQHDGRVSVYQTHADALDHYLNAIGDADGKPHSYVVTLEHEGGVLNRYEGDGVAHDVGSGDLCPLINEAGLPW